jgi:hypothetical protein
MIAAEENKLYKSAESLFFKGNVFRSKKLKGFKNCLN